VNTAVAAGAVTDRLTAGTSVCLSVRQLLSLCAKRFRDTAGASGGGRKLLPDADMFENLKIGYLVPDRWGKGVGLPRNF